jgi:transposase
MKRSNKSYTEEFKRDAMKLALKSDSVNSTAKELGIPGSTLHTWLRNAVTVNQEEENNNIINLAEELKHLRKENARLREEKEILKKAAAYFAKESK